MESTIISQIAKKRNVSPEQVSREINEIIDEIWRTGQLSEVFSEIPSPEQFIKKFAFLFLSAFK